MSRAALVGFLLSLASAAAQLIPAGSPLPRTPSPPVVFLNGYQNDCGSSSFANTFGIADQVLQNTGRISVFFDNCTVSGRPSIEKLGDAFASFLAGLRYSDGGRVETVDVVAHSMGGLILRSYLAGKQEQDGAFRPPATVPVRKAIFLATPHFGSPVASIFGFNTQVDELGSGSFFVFDLATWNDGTDDLRGIDAIAVAGNGGTGLAVASGFDDGVVSLSSASLAFALAGRTRILPLCHVEGGGLVSLGRFCASDAKGIARIRAATDDTARILVSFLSGTSEWQGIGQAAEDNPLLSTGAGLFLRPHTAADARQRLNGASALSSNGTTKNLNKPNTEVAYTDLFPAGNTTLRADTPGGLVENVVSLEAGAARAYVVKPGPRIRRVLPGAADEFPYTFAPRMIVAIYGENLASGNAANVRVNGVDIPLFYISATQINAVLPDGISGLVRLEVSTAAGVSGVNLLVEAVRPQVFSLDGTGTGVAAAVNVRAGQVVGPNYPLRAGDTLALFLTGLGAVRRQGSLDYAVIAPTVTVGGLDCPVTFAGAAPGYQGLDQINCTVPGPGRPGPALVRVSSGGRRSNAVTVPFE